MTGALIILGVLILTGIILRLTHRPDAPAETPAPEPAEKPESEECCGLHAVCEKKAVSADGPLYFDDEELDRYKGRAGSSYDDDETEEFRQVLYTLLPEDVFAWGAALGRRGIELPDPLRDEWVMLCEEIPANKPS